MRRIFRCERKFLPFPSCRLAQIISPKQQRNPWKAHHLCYVPDHVALSSTVLKHCYFSTQSTTKRNQEEKTLADGTKMVGCFDEKNPKRLISGTITLPDQRVYHGEFDFETGAPLDGCQLEEEGDLYKGSFNAQWQRCGRGEAWLVDGTHYKGQFSNDELVEGTVEIPNGTDTIIFEGTLSNEEFVQGTLHERNYSYTGEFSRNAPHGQGELKFSGGATQTGTFYAGKLHGPNGQMKLESGYLYLGNFVYGVIRMGELRTPSYNYEGTFSELGVPDGNGRMEQLTCQPKLIFTGKWQSGMLVQGACVDEDGNPVDYKNDVRLQEQTRSQQEILIDNFLQEKMKNAEKRAQEQDEEYHQVAEKQYQEKGRYPPKYELGYDQGPIKEGSDGDRSLLEKIEKEAEVMKDAFDETLQNAKQQMGADGEFNEKLARGQQLQQFGAQKVMESELEYQHNKFKEKYSSQFKK